MERELQSKIEELEDKVEKVSQSIALQKNVMKGKIVPSEVTVKLLPKALTANQARGDDKIETIKKRFKVFLESSPPVISYYGEKGKVRKQGLLIRFLSQSRQSL
ncbi:UMP-CMP kinase 3-like isoform X2 [Arachis hypogaea]|uniref:UMP-CMP kinase 3-like isoform X2 n=1 Tax=Arachis hypogaea TaxID=3818 RepID=UPI003B228D40|nr:UMP-CMP kinase [Arachis hypogaea]